MKLKHWLIFILLGVIWSASFLWIKIALDEIGPFTLVTYRAGLGLLTGLVVAAVLRIRIPRDWATWRVFIVLGILNVAIPFSLISWGEQSIDSAVASVLNATVPLFTIVIAHIFLRDDRITVPKLTGLLIGFGGVVLLLSQDFDPGAHNSLLGQAAVIAASASYAVSYIYARRNTQNIPGEIRGTLPLASAVFIVGATASVVEAPLKIPHLPITWIGLLWLGVLGTGLALIMQYHLVHEIGPTRATLVTYLLPPGGVLLGVVFRQEVLTWQLLAGTILILASIAVVNWEPKK